MRSWSARRYKMTGSSLEDRFCGSVNCRNVMRARPRDGWTGFVLWPWLMAGSFGENHVQELSAAAADL
jgi:hypothetical protein